MHLVGLYTYCRMMYGAYNVKFRVSFHSPKTGRFFIFYNQSAIFLLDVCIVIIIFHNKGKRFIKLSFQAL